MWPYHSTDARIVKNLRVLRSSTEKSELDNRHDQRARRDCRQRQRVEAEQAQQDLQKDNFERGIEERYQLTNIWPKAESSAKRTMSCRMLG